MSDRKPLKVSSGHDWNQVIKRWFVLVVFVVAGIAGWFYWQHSRLYLSTDDAYVGGNVVSISAQVPGKIAKVYVSANQHVHAGEPLFDIDAGVFRLEVQKAQAQLVLAQQNEYQAVSAVQIARAILKQKEAEMVNAESMNRRDKTLASENYISAEEMDNARTALIVAKTSVAAAKGQLTQAIDKLGQPDQRNAGVEVASAHLLKAKLDLSHIHVRAPCNGIVSNINLQPGSYVLPGESLFALIDDRDYWVDANFKETELAYLHKGEKAKVVLDTYPDLVIQGEVQSLSGGSGTAFSLLPPQNATGNWVKVTQRVPVRIRLLNQASAPSFQIGTTATVTVQLGSEHD